jgi:hypothetical protein
MVLKKNVRIFCKISSVILSFPAILVFQEKIVFLAKEHNRKRKIENF